MFRQVKLLDNRRVQVFRKYSISALINANVFDWWFEIFCNALVFKGLNYLESDLWPLSKVQWRFFLFLLSQRKSANFSKPLPFWLTNCFLRIFFQKLNQLRNFTKSKIAWQWFMVHLRLSTIQTILAFSTGLARKIQESVLYFPVCEATKVERPDYDLGLF